MRNEVVLKLWVRTLGSHKSQVVKAQKTSRTEVSH